MPAFKTRQTHYRKWDEDKALNADAIEVALRGNAYALIETAKRWLSESGGTDEFLSAVESLQTAIKLHCLDCGANTREIGHDYMLRDRLWISIRPESLGKLCHTCAEARLGRQLVSADFSGVCINREIEQLLAGIRSQHQRPTC